MATFTNKAKIEKHVHACNAYWKRYPDAVHIEFMRLDGELVSAKHVVKTLEAENKQHEDEIKELENDCRAKRRRIEDLESTLRSIDRGMQLIVKAKSSFTPLPRPVKPLVLSPSSPPSPHMSTMPMFESDEEEYGQRLIPLSQE